MRDSMKMKAIKWWNIHRFCNECETNVVKKTEKHSSSVRYRDRESNQKERKNCAHFIFRVHKHLAGVRALRCVLRIHAVVCMTDLISQPFSKYRAKEERSKGKISHGEMLKIILSENNKKTNCKTSTLAHLRALKSSNERRRKKIGGVWCRCVCEKQQATTESMDVESECRLADDVAMQKRERDEAV